MKKTKKITVTIGIPAHNEEQNIASVLASVFDQRRREYRVEQIIVMCDGCNDNTAKIARVVARKHPEVCVIEGGRRKGKSTRLNELFLLSKSDVFVAIDSDIILASRDTLDSLIQPFHNSQIGLTSGNDRPYPQKGYFTRITHEVFDLWYETRKDLNHGDSVHNIHGPIYAMRREVYKTCLIPSHINSDDHFVYFQNKLLGYRYMFVRKAFVYTLIASDVKEYFTQHSRWLGGSDCMIRHFGPWVNEYYDVPREFKIRAILKRLRINPILLAEAVLLQLALRMLKPIFIQKKDTGRWKMIGSTKLALPK